MATSPRFPLGGQVLEAGRATATCFCGAVSLAFPTESPGLVNSFICHCTDCHKITASLFATNFSVRDSDLTHLRGEDKLRQFAKSGTIKSGNTMTNYFCSVCGTLMYRRSSGYEGLSILRVGTVDDFSLHETKLKPWVEQFVEDRESWLKQADGARQVHGDHLAGL